MRTQLVEQAANMSLADRLKNERNYAQELMNAGKNEEAVQADHTVEQEMKTLDPQQWKLSGSDLLTHEAIACLRMGEVQNCCDHNNANSCLLPISGSGIHTRQEGSRNAIKCLLEALKIQPDDLAARWLLNIAYMTVGEYPQKVPARWLIPLKDYGGEAAHEEVLQRRTPIWDWTFWAVSGSVTMEDFEGNGLLDLLISSFDRTVNCAIFATTATAPSPSAPKKSGLLGEIGGLNIITTDYNNGWKPRHCRAARRMVGARADIFRFRF